MIVEAGYLVRSAWMSETSLYIMGDLNTTVPINIIGAPAHITALYFNDIELDYTSNPTSGELSSTLSYTAPTISLPDLSALDWKYLDDLPEIQSAYDDSAWTVADKNNTNTRMRMSGKDASDAF